MHILEARVRADPGRGSDAASTWPMGEPETSDAKDDRTDPGFGVYVHVPFCARRCDYCDFATWTDRAHLTQRYVDACLRDLDRRSRRDAHEPPPRATSIFFGGGTPSLLPADQLVRILAAIPRTADAEVTVECNPDTVDDAKLGVYRDAGVNRLSFGVQSLVPHVLASLGRTHDRANVEAAVAAARTVGFTSFNLDIIYGAHGESIADWEATVRGVLELDPPHVSAYALTVEPGTPLDRRIKLRELAAPDDDDQADKYVLADDLLAGSGLACYEISNWARTGHECRHNRLYWGQGEYLGIGCAAHGHTSGRRWWTHRSIDRYLDAVERDESPESGSEVLDPHRHVEERLTLALRTRAGALLDDVDVLGVAARLDAYLDAGLIELDGRRVTLTRPGRMLANEVTAGILAALDPHVVGRGSSDTR
jgi:putative oxygen-independent coproporphyrinogen III oxidase